MSPVRVKVLAGELYDPLDRCRTGGCVRAHGTRIIFDCVPEIAETRMP